MRDLSHPVLTYDLEHFSSTLSAFVIFTFAFTYTAWISQSMDRFVKHALQQASWDSENFPLLPTFSIYVNLGNASVKIICPISLGKLLNKPIITRPCKIRNELREGRMSWVKSKHTKPHLSLPVCSYLGIYFYLLTYFARPICLPSSHFRSLCVKCISKLNKKALQQRYNNFEALTFR